MSSPIIMNPHSLETPESSPGQPKCTPATSPSITLLPGPCSPPRPLWRHPLPMIPQQRVGQTHCVFIELIHLLPSPLSPTRRALGVPATTLTSPPIPCALSKVDNILGFRLRSRHAHKQQRKLASLAGKAAQRLMASRRCALKAVDQTEFRGKGKRSPSEYFHREQERWE